MKYYCNPINVPYRYQFNKDPRSGEIKINREAADPSMIRFHGKYYLFASMNLSVWVSEDLADWETYRLPENLPLYDYAPDVRVCGDYVYFCASKQDESCDYYRTKDIIKGPYERITGTFDFWDPNLFFDDDGKVYFYWGCSNVTPVWGVELDPETMHPKTERIELISGRAEERGYERIGEDNSEFPRSDEEVEKRYGAYLSEQGISEEALPQKYRSVIRGLFSAKPYIEGAWMDKHEGRYYLQYACTGTEYNVYGDGVYVSDSPLGPFTPAENNPYSFHPGGFMPGAGHGSTMYDRDENLWHASTMRISVNHQFERRVGIWPAGYDKDGELFCNQNYGDWPIAVDKGKNNPWRDPEWYILSYAKPTSCSSCKKGKGSDKAVNEDARNWWHAGSAESGQWLQVDLEAVCDVRAVQVNFADDQINEKPYGEIRGSASQPRYIEERVMHTRWKLEGSLDGKEYFIIEDKSDADTDLPHDLIVRENGISARYVRLTVIEVPYHVNPCISGLRIFGHGIGEKPKAPVYIAARSDDRLDLNVQIEAVPDATGYNILWGQKEEKLYHSYQVFRNIEDVKERLSAVLKKRIGALVREQDYFVRVDAFNESGITKGNAVKL